jgi:hypothetical protein
MALDPDLIRSRLDGWRVAAAPATTGEDPDLGEVLDPWTVDLDPVTAARFVELAEEAYDRWQDEALDRLARAIGDAYRQATESAPTP